MQRCLEFKNSTMETLYSLKTLQQLSKQGSSHVCQRFPRDSNLLHERGEKRKRKTEGWKERQKEGADAYTVYPIFFVQNLFEKIKLSSNRTSPKLRVVFYCDSLLPISFFMFTLPWQSKTYATYSLLATFCGVKMFVTIM